MNPNLRDALLTQSKALTNGAGSAVTDGFKVNDAGFDFNAEMELLIEAPALTTGELPDAGTMTYEIQQATDAAFTSPTSVYGICLTQTGASGAGAAAASKRVRLPTDVQAYVRLRATKSGSGNASGKSASLSQLF